MKTEDIDKRIGMPDVDKEWARFEQEVISGGTKRHSALAWALGIGIAASVALLIKYRKGTDRAAISSTSTTCTARACVRAYKSA